MKKTNNLALITGGAKRIGREIAFTLAQKNYDILLSYNNSKKAAQDLSNEIKDKFPVDCQIFQSDLSDITQVKSLADFALEISKNWTLLINNASIFHKSKFLDKGQKELFDNMNIHLFSPLFLAKELAINAAKNSLQNCQIINLIDKNIARYDTSYFYYLLSKKSLAELTKMLALELAPNIRVNGISPGFILNPIDENGELNTKSVEIIKKIPLQKKGDVKNICQTVEFLLNNDFVNGQIISIDGGASLNHAG